MYASQIQSLLVGNLAEYTCENLRRRKSLYMITALKMFFFKNQTVHVHILSPFPSYLFARRIMAKLEGKVRAPKRAGGRTKIHNNCEGLSEEVIDAKNLRTP